MLTSLERKAALLEGLGIHELVVVRFDREFAGLSPGSFCRAVLSERLGARVVFVGDNFRFGHLGEGTAAHLAEYGATHGFEVQPVALVEDDGQTISSTRIRELITSGRVAQAARLLGRPHMIEGTVTSGAGRGRSLQAPTANLTPARDMCLPRLGVYVTRSLVDDSDAYPSVTSVGTNPTFESGHKVRVETVLLDWSGDLYGRHLAVQFLDRIRGQQSFPDAGSLALQIQKDIEVARRVHSGEYSGSGG